ncbi:hypothetical protein ACFRCW_19415 [Streptomyces sp. NPDC056653]|uniref:hypothetical protein n=1 Tax=unclassified Streptomyces TaxID=2593676 RepID=UPI0033A5DAEC
MKLKKRISVTATSVVVAGVAVLGAGGTASAATPELAHDQRPAVSVKATDYRWDHSVSYLIEQGYSWDGVRGWHHDDRVTDATRYGHGGHFYRWDDNGCGWKFDRSYRYDWNRYEHDGRDRHHHDRNHSDR